MVQNLHTHTTFCDGKNTPAELAEAALALGMDALGFSGHSPLPFDTSWTMTPEAVPVYRREILALRARYAGRLQIFLGLEQDMDSPPPADPYEYIIGSVHCLTRGGERFYVDESEAALTAAASRLYGGDFLTMVEDYYARVSQLTGCQIAGHLDLITKFNEGDRLFSTQSPRYRLAAGEAIRQLAGRGLLFEVNTGAMARGYRTAPYPAADLLREIRAAGGRILITSDCHSADGLLYAFADAAQLALRCGFREAMVLTEDGFVPQKLDSPL